MKHTPAKWERGGLTISASGCGVIAVCPTPNNGGVFECSANAKLIASAPALLAALQDVAKAYQDMFDVMPVAWQTYDNIVTQAIALATGKEG